MAGNHLFLFINRKKHNKLPHVLSSGAFWGWISVGGKQPTEKLLLLLIDMKQGRAGAEAEMSQVWAHHNPNIGEGGTAQPLCCSGAVIIAAS